MTRFCSLTAASSTVLALAVLQSCPAQDPQLEDPRQPDPKPAAATAQDPRSLIDAVLDRHHGPLRGTLDKVLIELRAEPEAAPTQALLSLPDKMRVDYPENGIELLLDGTGWRCDGRKPAVKLKEGEALASLAQLRHHLRALVLAPLYEAKKIERKGPGVLALILPHGETWRLQLDEASLVLEELRGPAGAVQFESFLETGVTVLPAKVVLPRERLRYVKFRANPSLLHPRLFADPALPLPNGPSKPRTTNRRTVGNPDERPPKAVLQDIPRRMFLVLADPGGWERRTKAIVRSGNALWGKGQTMGGLPSYRHAESEAQLLIPFMPDQARGHQPFIRGPKDVVLHVPDHTAIVLAPMGTWDDVLKRGKAEINAYLAANDLEADGHLLTIPLIDAGVTPSAADLRKIQIRLEQRVRKRD